MNMRTVPDLIAQSLVGGEDDDAAWSAIRELHVRGDEESFAAAMGLLQSSSAKARGRGADVLAQLGSPSPSAELRSRCADALLEVLARETSATVLESIGVALGHLQDPRAVGALSPLRKHDAPEVRLAVALGVLPHSTPEAAATLIELSSDVDDDVRNWATFGLRGLELDTPALREALIQRLSDEHAEVRGEALLGLAERHDGRVVEPLRRELTKQIVGVLAVEAAGALGDPAFLPVLEPLRGTTQDFFDESVESAIRLLQR